jgi:four helix bundle protein
MGLAKSFRDLEVYRRAGRAAKLVFNVSCAFPTEQRYALTDQIRRSSRAVNSMIAEAWARRPYPAAFINKLNEALGEAMEIQAWLDHALACKYISREQYRSMDDEWQQIGAMIVGMCESASSFCRLPLAARKASDRR